MQLDARRVVYGLRRRAKRAWNGLHIQANYGFMWLNNAKCGIMMMIYVVLFVMFCWIAG